MTLPHGTVDGPGDGTGEGTAAGIGAPPDAGRGSESRRGDSAAPAGKAALPPRARPGREGLDAAGAAALALSALWVLAVAAATMFLPSEGGPAGLGWAGGLVALVLPVAAIWAAALSVRAVRVLREEGARLEAAVDAIRHLAAQQAPAHGSGIRPAIESRLEEIARAQRQTEAAITRLSQAGGPPGGAAAPLGGRGRVPAAPVAGPSGTSQRSARAATRNEPSTAPDGAQQSLALGAPDDPGEPISTPDLIRALHFPEDEGDADGFRALRAALRDRQTAGLVRSAQDVLTLLAEDGIYMDDLAPDRARPEMWRRFAQGERGKGVAALGGVRDRSCLALTAGRMRQDPVFRDTAHHFLRKFDKTFAEVEPLLSDADIVALSETRTARAFMLLGRVSGTFD
jgi:hypothetical protein